MTVEINLLKLLHQAKATEENSPIHGNADHAKHQRTIKEFKEQFNRPGYYYTAAAPLVLGAVLPPDKEQP